MGLFGSRKQAEALAAQLAQSRASEKQLAAELANSGALTKVEIEAQINAARQELSAIRTQVANERAVAAQAINAELATLNQLRNLVINVRDAGIVQDVGLYDFEHPAESSVALMAELSNVRLQIKEQIKNNTAWSATQNFTFNNSEAKGRKFVNDLAKLSLAAYNAVIRTGFYGGSIL